MKLSNLFGSLLDSDKNNLAPRQRFVFWISILLAALFLYLALRGLDWVGFVSSLRNASYGLIPLVLIWSSMSNWIRALRWRILLTTEQDISAPNVFWANMAGYFGNNILPARAGELIRAVYVSKENHLSVSYSLATGLVERFIDLIALVILGSTALARAGILARPLQDALKVMSVVAMIGIATLLAMPYLGGHLRRSLEVTSVSNTSAKAKIGKQLEQFLQGVEALHHPKRAVAFILFTALIWLLDGVGTLLLAQAVNLSFSLVESFLLLAGLGLSSAIPSTPGYVGVYQFVAVTVLQPFGVSNASAIVFILFLQATNLLVTAFWGGIAIWRAASFSLPKP